MLWWRWQVGVPSEYLDSLAFDYSYPSIVTNMCLWLTGQADLELFRPFSPGVQVGATLLFWSWSWSWSSA